MTSDQLTALYQQYALLVFRRCERIIGARDAEDAMQETFLKARRAQPPVAGASTLVWLYRIATHTCFDLLRSSRRRSTQLAQLAGEEPSLERNPDRAALISLALRSAEPEVAEIGLLHHLDGLTQEELVEQTGLSRKTVAKRLEAFRSHVVARVGDAGGVA